MRQHYLPRRAHLANFTDPNTPQGQEPYLWLCDPETGDWRRRAPQNVGWERDYYVVTDDEGNETNAVEHSLGAVEGEATRIISRLIAEERPFGDGDRWNLALFIALMYSRVPGRREQVRRFQADLADLSRQMAEDPMVPGPEGKFAAAERDDLARTTLSSVEILARLIDRLQWQIWVSKAPDFMGTSDMPAVVSNPNIPDDSFYRPGLAQPDMLLTLPLTRTAFLLARWGRRGLHYLPAVASDVETFNQMSWIHGDRIFAAPEPGVPGAKGLADTLRRGRRDAESPERNPESPPDSLPSEAQAEPGHEH